MCPFVGLHCTMVQHVIILEEKKFFQIRGAVKNCPNRREGGLPHFKKLKRDDFLTKVGEGGGHKTYCQK